MPYPKVFHFPRNTSNNSFKPNLLRYSKGVAQKACHAFASTAQVGLIQALYGRWEKIIGGCSFGDMAQDFGAGSGEYLI